MTQIYIGAGSNQNGEYHLKCAYQDLKHVFDEVVMSPIYISDAYGSEVGKKYHNCVFSASTTLDVDACIALLKQIENENGRQRPARLYGVSLDLDLLLFGYLVDKARRIPREDIYKYDFVSQPLKDIAPDLILPRP